MADFDSNDKKIEPGKRTAFHVYLAYDEIDWPFDVPGNYNFGSDIDVTGGAAHLKGPTYPSSDPPIFPNTGFPFTTELDTFTESVETPGSTEIKYHCSSDDGATWKYWDGVSWVTTDDSYTQANTGSEVNTNIGSLATSGTFKFRALLHTSSSSETPLLENIFVAESIVKTQKVPFACTLKKLCIYFNADCAWTGVVVVAIDGKVIARVRGASVKVEYSLEEPIYPNSTVSFLMSTPPADAKVNIYGEIETGGVTRTIPSSPSRPVYRAPPPSFARPDITHPPPASSVAHPSNGQTTGRIPFPRNPPSGPISGERTVIPRRIRK